MATPIPPNQASFEVRAMVDAAFGRLSGDTLAYPVCGVTTDSRAVSPGSAFVCIRGDRYDGHDYIDAAISAGATAIVVERGRARPKEDRVAVVEVEDTLVAWGLLARAHLRAWRRADSEARVVAVTGSAGKTTTKELCAALLRSVAGCLSTSGNLNNRIGMPAMAFVVEPCHRFAVFELGMSVSGEIAVLASISEPDVAILTNVGLAHAAGVGGTMEAVAREKGELFAHLGRDGVAVANADDPAVMAQVARGSARAVLFGRAERADVRLVRRKPLGVAGSRIVVRRADVESAFVLPIPGEAAAVDFVAALAAAEAVKGDLLSDVRIASVLRAHAPIAGRMQVRRLGGDIVVIDDAYNANPASSEAALKALREMTAGRRVAVLGEMKELGATAESEHARLGDAVAAAGVELVVSCGGLSDVTALAARARGVEAVLARDAAGAASATVERARAGDCILVKASRAVGAEAVVLALVRLHGEELG